MNRGAGGGSVEDLLRAATQRLEAAGIPAGEARAEARMLLAEALGVSREELRLRPERRVTAGDAGRFASLIARRARREPLAYITGRRAFYGMEFVVSPAVLIPRPETEFLVETALRQGGRRIADVGTGSGAIAVAVAVHAPEARLWASDISPDALAVAERNAARHGVSSHITFVAGNALDPLAPFAPFDVIVSNPPYIAAADVEALLPEVRDWEPRIALGTHHDALFFYRRFAREAPALLAPDGLLAVEVGQGQADAVAELWRGAGLTDVQTVPDYSGIARVVRGTASP